MNSIAIAPGLTSARILDEPECEERHLRYGATLWQADPALPVRRESPTITELELAAFAVAMFRR